MPESLGQGLGRDAAYRAALEAGTQIFAASLRVTSRFVPRDRKRGREHNRVAELDRIREPVDRPVENAEVDGVLLALALLTLAVLIGTAVL